MTLLTPLINLGILLAVASKKGVIGLAASLSKGVQRTRERLSVRFLLPLWLGAMGSRKARCVPLHGLLTRCCLTTILAGVGQVSIRKGNHIMTNLITISDLNTSFDNEPRILDIQLGELLGMSQPRNIRQLLESNRQELERYGIICTHNVQNQKRGRPATEYYLNEPQSLLIMLRSDAPRAPEARKQVIDVFMSYRNGKYQIFIDHKPVNDPLLPKLEKANSEIETLKGEIIRLRYWINSYHVWIDKLILGDK